MMDKSQLKVGQTVLFGRPNGEKTLGKILKLNAAAAKIEQLEERGVHRVRAVGKVWRVGYALIFPAPAAATPAPAVATPAPAVKGERWMEVSDSDVRHIWKDREGNEVSIAPTFYGDSGTPIDDDGDDLEYVRTEIRI